MAHHQHAAAPAIQSWIGFAHGVLGTAAVLFPHVSGWSANVLLCAIVAVAGLTRLLHALACGDRPCQFAHALWALQANIGAALLLILPLIGLSGFGVTLAFYFLFAAAASSFVAQAGAHPGPAFLVIAGVNVAFALIALVMQTYMSPMLAGLLLGLDLVAAGAVLMQVRFRAETREVGSFDDAKVIRLQKS